MQLSASSSEIGHQRISRTERIGITVYIVSCAVLIRYKTELNKNLINPVLLHNRIQTEVLKTIIRQKYDDKIWRGRKNRNFITSLGKKNYMKSLNAWIINSQCILKSRVEFTIPPWKHNKQISFLWKRHIIQHQIISLIIKMIFYWTVLSVFLQNVLLVVKTLKNSIHKLANTFIKCKCKFKTR